MKRTSGVLWGLILIAAGTIIGLKELNIIDINLFFDGWWTLFIIVPCIVSFFRGGDKTWCLIGICAGVLLLLVCQGILETEMLWRLAVPIIAIIIGFHLVIRAVLGNTSKEIMNKIKNSGSPIKVCCAAFSSQSVNLENQIFSGADFTAVFGDVKCDLRNTVFEDDAAISACSIFGGVNIILPENVNVKTNSISIFGRVYNKEHKNSENNQYTVYIDGTCIFGGINLR